MLKLSPSAIVFFSAVAAVLIAWKYLKWRRGRALKMAKQEPRLSFPIEPPGNGAPIYTGIRIIELATVVAGPSAARIFGDLGAEVIKIEEPKGDFWRKFLLEYEQDPIPRTFSSAFEAVNLSKQSLQLDLKKKDQLLILKSLLKDADVFITNVRIDGLVRMGLDYENFREEFPHVVFAHLSAWGNAGEDRKLPGYDLGAFWNATGLSSTISEEGFYSRYPLAFGDVCTGTALAAGVSLALADRVVTGLGCRVETSLSNTGVWCVAPLLCKIKSDEISAAGEIPKYERVENREDDPSNGIFECSDGIHLTILGRGTSTNLNLRKIFSVAASATEREAYREIKEKCKKETFSEISEKLYTNGVEHCELFLANETIGKKSPSEYFSLPAKVLSPSPVGVKDVSHFVDIPFLASCSERHGIKSRAPGKGAQTRDIIKNSWHKVHYLSLLPRANKYIGERRLMAGVNIVEFSDPTGRSMIASATASYFIGYGARVIKIENSNTNGNFENSNGDPMRADADLFTQFNSGKLSVSVDFSAEGAVQNVLDRLLPSAILFITDAPLDLLARLNIDPEKIRARFPAVVYALATPWGISNSSRSDSGEKGAWYFASGIANCLAGRPPAVPPEIPPHLGDLVSSFSFLSGCAAGIFHLRRTGEGNLIDINLLRSAVWSIQAPLAIQMKDPTKIKFLQLPKEAFREYFPIPTANCFRTKDGMWVQLLGVELPRHLHKTLKCFNISLQTYVNLIPTIITKVLPSKEKNRLLRVVPIFSVINKPIEREIAKLNWKELKARLDQHDIWHTPIRTPLHALLYRQFQQNGCFVPKHDGSGFFCSNPLRVSSTQNELAPPPQLGENNDTLE